MTHHPAEVAFNGKSQPVGTVEALDAALAVFDREPEFELWLCTPGGRSLCMLRNGANAWLMYLRFAGDSGFASLGDPSATGTASYTLSNGQVDEYPLSWCLDIGQCYKAVAYFFANEGARPAFVEWQETA